MTRTCFNVHVGRYASNNQTQILTGWMAHLLIPPESMHEYHLYCGNQVVHCSAVVEERHLSTAVIHLPLRSGFDDSLISLNDCGDLLWFDYYQTSVLRIGRWVGGCNLLSINSGNLYLCFSFYLSTAWRKFLQTSCENKFSKSAIILCAKV